MRALVISDTHFGAWTGDDLLSESAHRDRLAVHLDDVDEVIVLGDLFDFLFGRVEDALTGADGVLTLLGDKLAGRRLVVVPGNHDHHLIVRDGEADLWARLAGDGRRRRRDGASLRALLARRLADVEVEVAYPTYRFREVLLTHGHFLDLHSRRQGSIGDRFLARALWSIAAGGPEGPRTVADYEATTTLLTEILYTIAQLPHGTSAQRNVFRLVERIAQLGARASRALDSLERGRRVLRRFGESPSPGPEGGKQAPDTILDPAHLERARARERRRRLGRPERMAKTTLARVNRTTDPRAGALEAFAESLSTLGWARDVELVVFAHTHQPLAGVRARATDRVRYWNTGSWFYEPELTSRAAFVEYLRKAWPGTVVLLDTDEPEPRLLELLADLNPLNGGAGLDVRGRP